MCRPKLACQCRVLGLHPRPGPPAQSRATLCGSRLTWGLSLRAARRLAPKRCTPSLFTRWPHRRAAPWRRGHQRGDSGARAAAARAAQQLSPPPGFQQRRWEPCRGALRAGAPGAVHQEGAGVWGSRRNPACASPGAGCEPQSQWGSFYTIWVQPVLALQLVQCGECRCWPHSTFPYALSLPLFLPPSSIPGHRISRRVLPPSLAVSVTLSLLPTLTLRVAFQAGNGEWDVLFLPQRALSLSAPQSTHALSLCHRLSEGVRV